MESNISLLYGILKREKSLYETLLKLAKTKQEQIIANEVDALLETIEQEKEILQNIEEEENKRVNCLEALAENGSSFLAICQRAGISITDKLKGLRKDLLLLLDELAETNEINKRLLQDALGLNQMMFEGLAGGAERGNYDPARPTEPGSMLLDKRV